MTAVNAHTFALERSRRFGTRNPSRMNFPFWLHMVQTGEIAFAARRAFDPQGDAQDGGPVWCFHRFGPTRTRLADGTVVCIGGEHEDGYDPDFCIYNDVIVVSPDGQKIDIFGYPKEVFPPTDFHTATLLGDRIVVVGGLGYANERGGAQTPVFSLDLRTYAMTRLHPTGPSPGWIYLHRVELVDGRRTLRVWDGKRVEGTGRKERHVPNDVVSDLDLSSLTWRPVPGPPPPEAVPDVDWPYPWVPIPPRAVEFSLGQLREEAPPGHPLFAADVRPLAEDEAWLTLFRLRDGTNRVAEVRLDAAGLQRHAELPQPEATFFDSLEAWLRVRATSMP